MISVPGPVILKTATDCFVSETIGKRFIERLKEIVFSNIHSLLYN